MRGNSIKIKGILIFITILFAGIVSTRSAYAATAYDFGGITSSPSSCPATYTSHQFIYGSLGFFPSLYYCYRDASISGGIEFDFGGMYTLISKDGGITRLKDKPNPVTGDYTCPSGYTSSSAGNGSPTWKPSYYLISCIKDVSSEPDSKRRQDDFGGMWGTYTCDPQSAPNLAEALSICDHDSSTFLSNGGKTYDNAFTGELNCSTGYTTGAFNNLSSTGPLNSEGEFPEKVWSIGVCTNSPPVIGNGFIDIGLRVKEEGISAPTPIAIELPSKETFDSNLMMAKNGYLYHVALVNPTDPAATTAKIRINDGTIMALRRFTGYEPSSGLNLGDTYDCGCGAHGGPLNKDGSCAAPTAGHANQYCP